MEQKTKNQQELMAEQRGVGRKGAEEDKLNKGNVRRGKGNEA
jgi:hypothetical protein